MILHYIPKDKLREHWDYVKHGLELVRAKGHMEWIIEDVYCDCYENRSMLFLGIVDNKAVGFVVLQPMATHFMYGLHGQHLTTKHYFNKHGKKFKQ